MCFCLEQKLRTPIMKYSRSEAMEFAKENLHGIWAAALTPFDGNLKVDEEGARKNIRHWLDDLEIDGLFIAGKQGEFFSMSVEERKRCMEIAVDETQRSGTQRRGGTILSCSDQNMDTTLDLAHYAEHLGADFIVIHAPILHFTSHQDEILFEYYEHISDQLDIGIAMWSHPDSGYIMSPELCDRIANLPNIVAIKYSVPRDLYSHLTRIAGEKLIVSTASEEEWFDNIIELGWKLYLCSSPPYLLQTKTDKRMREYTNLAFDGKIKEAKEVRDSLNPVREAIKNTKPGDKPPAHGKYWQELLGQVGGNVRPPMLNLTDHEKEITKAAFDTCGLT